MDKVYHQFHRKKRGRPGQLHRQISSPGKRVAVRVAFIVTGSGQEKPVCRCARTPWSNLRSFHCRKPQRSEHGGQIFVVQVEGSLFSYQHNAKMRVAHKVSQMLKPHWTSLPWTWWWWFKIKSSFLSSIPSFNWKVLPFIEIKVLSPWKIFISVRVMILIACIQFTFSEDIKHMHYVHTSFY